MLCFHVKFVQTDGQTDTGKTICPELSIPGDKNLITDILKNAWWIQTANLKSVFGLTVTQF